MTESTTSDEVDIIMQINAHTKPDDKLVMVW
jgi:hypothetical protein